MPTDQFNVGLIQMSCSPDPDENLRRACEKVREAAKRGAQLVCLPELFRAQYFCQREDTALFDLAEPIPGPTTEALAPIARELKIVIVASIFEKRARGLYHNTAVIIENDGITWKEVFRCDEHLKNPSGFLGATPIAAVAGWRLQYEQHQDKGLVMYFTPLAQPTGGHVASIGVRWNAKVGRYQSLDRNYEQFLGEVPSLEPVQMQLKQ